MGNRGGKRRGWGALGGLAALAMLACTSHSGSPAYEGLDGGGGPRTMTDAQVIGAVPIAPSGTSKPPPPASGADGGGFASDAGFGEAGLPFVGDAGTGCRAPAQAGCQTCCQYDVLAGSCVHRTGFDWYSEQTVTPGICPINCPLCAPCSLHDEQQLLGLQPRATCDCSVDAGPDSCASPGSCGCYCAQLAALTARCGQLTP